MSIPNSTDENCLCGGINFSPNIHHDDVNSNKTSVCNEIDDAQLELSVKHYNQENKKAPRKPPITVTNVHLTLNKSNSELEKRIVEFGAISAKLFDIWQADSAVNGINGETVKNLSYMVCAQYLDVLQYFPAFLMILRNEIDKSILANNREAITYYNAIFNDKLYETIPIVEKPLILSGEMIQELTAKYNNRIANYSKLKKRNYQFAEGEIVGARDKEGKWWHAKILAKLFYQGQNVYYVEFSHWGPEFNEWIAETRRITKYNPRRHILYRPASMTNKHTTVRNGDKAPQKEDALDDKPADEVSEDEGKLDELE